MLCSLTTNYKKHGDSITIEAKLQKQTWFFVADFGICIVGSLSWKINLSKKTPMASISLSFCALACQNIMTLVKIVMIAWYDWTFRFSKAGCGCAETEKERIHHWSIPSSHVALLQELGLLFSSHHSQLSCHSPSAPANQASRAHVYRADWKVTFQRNCFQSSWHQHHFKNTGRYIEHEVFNSMFKQKHVLESKNAKKNKVISQPTKLCNWKGNTVLFKGFLDQNPPHGIISHDQSFPLQCQHPCQQERLFPHLKWINLAPV